MMTRNGTADAPNSAIGVRAGLGSWKSAGGPGPVTKPAEAQTLLGQLDQTVFVVRTPAGDGLVTQGIATLGQSSESNPDSIRAILPPFPPERLGDPAFLADHGLKYAYMTGAMANGIGSCDIVEAMNRAGMLGSFQP